MRIAPGKAKLPWICGTAERLQRAEARGGKVARDSANAHAVLAGWA